MAWALLRYLDLEVHRDRAVREGLQVDGKDLQRDVVVVQLVVAHRHVHIQREVVAVFQQEAFVDVRRLLVRWFRVVFMVVGWGGG